MLGKTNMEPARQATLATYDDSSYFNEDGFPRRRDTGDHALIPAGRESNFNRTLVTVFTLAARLIMEACALWKSAGAWLTVNQLLSPKSLSHHNFCGIFTLRI